MVCWCLDLQLLDGINTRYQPAFPAEAAAGLFVGHGVAELLDRGYKGQDEVQKKVLGPDNHGSFCLRIVLSERFF